MLIAAFAQYFFGISIFVSSIFLVLLVLVQRGRGGGLTGALGGPGGQSAFGTKAGDLFTRITIGVAAVWIFLCAASVVMLKSRGLPQLTGAGNVGSSSVGSEMGGDEGDLPGGDSLTPPTDSTSGLNMPELDLSGGTPANDQAEITELPSVETPATADAASETPAADAPPAEKTPETDASADTPVGTIGDK